MCVFIALGKLFVNAALVKLKALILLVLVHVVGLDGLSEDVCVTNLLGLSDMVKLVQEHAKVLLHDKLLPSAFMVSFSEDFIPPGMTLGRLLDICEQLLDRELSGDVINIDHGIVEFKSPVESPNIECHHSREYAIRLGVENLLVLCLLFQAECFVAVECHAVFVDSLELIDELVEAHAEVDIVDEVFQSFHVFVLCWLFSLLERGEA